MMEIQIDDIEQRFAELEEAKQRLVTGNQTVPRPKIQKVPAFLRDRQQFTKYYSPKMISIGPIHHHLQLGEDFKLLWAASYIKESNQSAGHLYQKIEDNISELKEQYANDTISDYNDRELAWMLFLDGCSVLEILNKADLMNPDKLHIKVDQLVFVQADLLLLENQLPFLVLKLLCNEDEAKALKFMDKFLKCHHFISNPVPKMKSGQELPRSEAPEHKVSVLPSPHHLLDYLRSKFFVIDPRTDDRKDITSLRPITYRSLQELKQAGIKPKKLKKPAGQNEIVFKPFILPGRLYLSELVVDDSTAPIFLNLIAYEMCPNFRNDFAVSSYVVFLDSLIDHPNDVKDLRWAGVLHNCLGSDEEVVKLFNTIASDVVPDSRKYAAVKFEMEAHYRSNCLRLLNNFYSSEFSTQWAIIGSVAGLLALFLTAIQTWFALPINKKQA